MYYLLVSLVVVSPFSSARLRRVFLTTPGEQLWAGDKVLVLPYLSLQCSFGFRPCWLKRNTKVTHNGHTSSKAMSTIAGAPACQAME